MQYISGKELGKTGEDANFLFSKYGKKKLSSAAQYKDELGRTLLLQKDMTSSKTRPHDSIFSLVSGKSEIGDLTHPDMPYIGAMRSTITRESKQEIGISDTGTLKFLGICQPSAQSIVAVFESNHILKEKDVVLSDEHIGFDFFDDEMLKNHLVDPYTRQIINGTYQFIDLPFIYGK